MTSKDINETYTFYDIPSAKGLPWSPNTWKTRAVLNAKNLQYKTVFLEYPDIQVELPKLGLGPGDDDSYPYTLPLLRISRSDGTEEYIRESLDQVKYLNGKYPYPEIDMDGPINDEFQKARKISGTVFMGLVLPAVPEKLSDKSAEYFYRTRKRSFGCSLQEVREKAIRDDDAWAKTKAWVEEARAFLRSNGGPFGEGKKLSWADVCLFGLLKWIEVTGRDEDWEKVMSWGGEEFKTFLSEGEKVFGKKID